MKISKELKSEKKVRTVIIIAIPLILFDWMFLLTDHVAIRVIHLNEISRLEIARSEKSEQSIHDTIVFRKIGFVRPGFSGIGIHVNRKASARALEVYYVAKLESEEKYF